MSRHLHIDPFSGAAGDMFLGLLFDLGLDPAVLESVPARLGLSGVNVACERTRRGALAAGRVHVVIRGWEEPPARSVGHGAAHGHDPDHHDGHEHADGHDDHRAQGAGHVHAHDHDRDHEHQHAHAHGLDHDHDHEHAHGDDHRHDHDHGGRTLADTLALVEAADLPPRAKAIARRAFEALYGAEAKVHGVPLHDVHLHEAGADDALVDVCGTALGLCTLDVTSVSCAAPVPLGGGSIHCAHGILPVPGPAVAALFAGVPVAGGPVDRELVTPTGAALLRAIVDEFRAMPALRLERAGHGAGAREDAHLPNVLRGLLGTLEAGPRERALSVLETALDDVNPQDVPVLVERLLAAGARDAMVTTVQMKKGRPGFLLTVVADPQDERALCELLLRESPTLGVRARRETRLEWDRDSVSVDTPWGAVRVKRAIGPSGRVLRGTPEFEDCRRVADAAGVRVDEVRQRAQQAFGRTHGPNDGD